MSEEIKQNVKKGGKHRKRMKNHTTFVIRDLQRRDEGQLYAVVDKALGNGRLNVICSDNKTRIAHIRGALSKKHVRIAVGDTILVALREFEMDKKCDVILKYDNNEISALKDLGDIPSNGIGTNLLMSVSCDTENNKLESFDFKSL